MKNTKFMDSSKYIKIILIVIFTVVLSVVGCKNSINSTKSPNSEEPTNYTYQQELAAAGTSLTCKNGPAAISGHITDLNSSKGIAGVKVSANGCITTTDAQGFYVLSDLAASDRAVITFSHDGYYQNSVIIQIKQYFSDTAMPSLNYLEHAIRAYDFQEIYSAHTEKTLQAAANASVTIPASIYMSAAGNNYNGKVIAGIAYEDVYTDKGRNAFPGAYEGRSSSGTIVPFVSYGFIAVDISDENGTKLNLINSAIISFPSTGRATAENIPLWHYDYLEGIWIEEGMAIRQPDGTYKGEISHPGAWGLNMPLESMPGIYRGRITYRDGTAAENVRVYAVGPNWIRTDLSTDDDGNFEIKVIPDSSFYLKAYDYKYRYEAQYKDKNGNNISIPAISSGEITER